MAEVRDIKLSTDKVLAHVTNWVGHVIFNNPERHNAVSLDMWDAVDTAFSALSSDDSVRVVVLSGAGGKSLFRVRIYQNLIVSAGQKKQLTITMPA